MGSSCVMVKKASPGRSSLISKKRSLELGPERCLLAGAVVSTSETLGSAIDGAVPPVALGNGRRRGQGPRKSVVEVRGGRQEAHLLLDSAKGTVDGHLALKWEVGAVVLAPRGSAGG